MTCCCCGAAMAQGLAPWHLMCPRCGYEAADFRASINRADAHQRIDEDARDGGLRALRQQNFTLLLDRMEGLRKPGAHLLDVGAAHGWFVTQAAERGWRALGLEPDEAICHQAAAQGANVREGFFPDALLPGETWDAIVFNDVFEHIPDPAAVMRACRVRLARGGVLVLNLPSSRGIFYRVSRALQRIGIAGFFERLWQKDLPSPHLHYFNAANLRLLAEREGLACTYAGALPSLHLEGLYQRIAYVKSGQRWLAPLVWLGVVIAYPLLRAAPPDIEVLFFTPGPDVQPGG